MWICSGMFRHSQQAHKSYADEYEKAEERKETIMHVTFHGAVREVTGSMHLIGTDTDHVLLDCGLHQGRRREAAEKNRVLPFDAAMISNMVLSHAHPLPLATEILMILPNSGGGVEPKSVYQSV